MNRLIAALLRSPLHWLVSRSLLLLTITGKRTGREHTFPVQYARTDDEIDILPGRPDEKRWWRNLENTAPVRVRLRGRERNGLAGAIRYDTEPDLATASWDCWAARFPRAAGAVGIQPGIQDGGHDSRGAARAGLVMVRVELKPAEASE